MTGSGFMNTFTEELTVKLGFARGEAFPSLGRKGKKRAFKAEGKAMQRQEEVK